MYSNQFTQRVTKLYEMNADLLIFLSGTISWAVTQPSLQFSVNYTDKPKKVQNTGVLIKSGVSLAWTLYITSKYLAK